MRLSRGKHPAEVYNYHRYYDPATGRYITSDPIGLAGGLNTYGYAFQNPLKYTDPDGLNPGAGCLVGGVVAGPLGCGIGGAIGTAVLGGATLAAILSVPGDTPIDDSEDDCDDDDDKDCKKASKWQLTQAGITSEHDFKREYVGGSLSLYDICACKDGTIVIRGVGMCGTSGPTIGTYARWK